MQISCQRAAWIKGLVLLALLGSYCPAVELSYELGQYIHNDLLTRTSPSTL